MHNNNPMDFRDDEPNFGKEVIDAMLSELDMECIAAKLPVLSVLVTHQDGWPSTAFWDSVQRYSLRAEDESDADLIKRSREAVYARASEYPETLRLLAQSLVVML